MIKLKKKIISFKNKKLIIGIVIYLFFSINCNDYFIEFLCLFPRTFDLYNGNHILCCSDGIYIYNSNFQEQLYFYEFKNKMSGKNDAMFITICQYSNNGNVIIITKNMFYFLSSEGEVIFEDDFNLETSGTFYTLVPYKDENNLNFFVGFINNSKDLNLQYYYINISSEKIELISNYVPKVKTTDSYIVGSNYFYGFSCQIMNSNNDILVCFCCHGYPLEIAAFWVSINSELKIIEDSYSFLVFDTRLVFIKSLSSQDKSKALICLSDMSNIGYYLIYDINSLQFSDAIQYMEVDGSWASDIQIQYFIQTQEYILSGTKNKQFKIVKFDKNMNIIQNSKSDYDYSLGDQCYGLNFYNIVFIPENENYIFIIDSSLSTGVKGRGYLFPDTFKPDEIFPISLDSQSSIINKPSHLITTILSTDNHSLIMTTIPPVIKTTIISSSITTTIPLIKTTIIQPHKVSTFPSSLINKTKSTIPLIKTTIIQSHKISTIPSSLITKIKSTIPSIKTTIIQPHKISTIPSSLINEIKSTISKIPKTTVIIPTSTFSKNMISTNLFTTTLASESIIKSIPKSSSHIFNSSYFKVSNLIQNSLTTLSSTSPSNSKLISSLFTSTHLSSNFSTILSSINFPDFSDFFKKNMSSSILQYSSSTCPEKEKKNNVTIKEESCSFEFFYKNIINNECEKLCSYNDFLNGICYINNLTEKNIMNITKNFRNLITKLDVNENTNIVINGNNVVYQVISSEEMDDNLDKNISIIDFGECEEKLKKVFGIDYILILQIDIFVSTSTNIVMKYEVYNPYTLEKIDLSICNDMTINTYLPYAIPDEDLDLYVQLQELGYDLYNPNDSFYQDYCSPYATVNKTDVLLSDRRLDYYKNISFCEEGCTYKNYDYIYKKVQCECQINNELDDNIDNIKFYSNLFLATFFEIENFSNIQVLKCFKLVFSKIGQIKNIGSYIFIILNLIYIILIFLFCKNGKKQFSNIINTVIRNKNIKMPIKKKTGNKKKGKMKIYSHNNNIIINKNIIIHNHYKEKKKNKNNNKAQTNKSNKSKILSEVNDSSKKNQLILLSPRITQKFPKSKFFNKQTHKILITNKKNTSKSKGNKFIYHYNDIELNSLTYQKAILYDKRAYSQYYCSLIRQKHLIIFTFISKIDYNLFIIKLSLFIFSFSLYFAVNTFFFNDNIIHKLYKTPGKIQFIYSILNIIYSTLISSTITLILKLLALSNKSILKLKIMKNKNKALKESSNIFKEFNIKFHIYFIVSFILLIFFWYFISAFCAVYNNSQISLIQNTICSFLVSLFYPFAINLIPGIFRISALRAKKKDKKCLYSFSNLISLI